MDSVLEVFTLIVILAAVYGLMVWSHKARTDRSANVGLYLLFGLPGMLLTVAGLALGVNGNTVGWFVVALGLSLVLPLARPFRKLMGVLTPMDPASPIDMMGIGVVLSVMVYFAFAITADPGAAAEVGAVTAISQFVNVAFFVAVAFIAVGSGVYRSVRDAVSRLGLTVPSWRDVVVGVVAVVPTFMLSIMGSLLTLYFQPDLFADLGETIDQMSAGTSVTLISVVLFASAGIGEEILFRGAIQPRFGIVLTSAFWALVHTQYQLSFVVLGLFLVGILFGLIRKYMNTTSAVIAHALYNAMVVILQSAG
jgi:membrane protease YdiL (CAAX protease family)